MTASPEVAAAFWHARETPARHPTQRHPTQNEAAERSTAGRVPAAGRGAKLELLTGPLPLWLAEEVLADIQARPLALRLFPMAPVSRLFLQLRCRAALRRRGEAGGALPLHAGLAAPGQDGDDAGGGAGSEAAWEQVADRAEALDALGGVERFSGDGAELRLVPGRDELAAGAELLAGRLLLESEVRRLLEERGGGRIDADPVDVLEGLVLRGGVRRRAAVQRDRMRRWRCWRCGTLDRVDVGPCARCGRDACAACTECARLGTARACEAIVYSAGRLRRRASQLADALPPEGVRVAPPATPGPAEPGPAAARTAAPLLHLSFPLSPPQQAASDALQDGDARHALVWAACGAGKTEVVFGAIEEALQAGGPVLFAVPRRDVVIELEGRLQQAFPSVPVKAIYGGSPTRFPDVPLIVATTHQVMRFYQRFRLVVLDEVDAYPYWGSRMLRRAVSRATIPGGRTLCLTATPPEVLLEKARRDEWRLITIPARHHGHPLPEPEFLLDTGLERLRHGLASGRRRVTLPRIVVEAVQEAVRLPDPLLVFVPAVDLVAPTARLLDRVCRSGAEPEADALPLAFGVHSRDPRRDAIREAFSRGEFPILVATTVLERGITVPGVNVLVLWADAEGIFDAASLIQMAGRAGRTADRPRGRVWFAAARSNRSMQAAAHRIAALNDEARRCGYLR